MLLLAKQYLTIEFPTDVGLNRGYFIVAAAHAAEYFVFLFKNLNRITERPELMSLAKVAAEKSQLLYMLGRLANFDHR